MKTPKVFTVSEKPVGETEHWFTVFVHWKDGNGGADRFETLKDAEAAVASLQRRGFDKPHSPVQIFEMSRKRIR